MRDLPFVPRAEVVFIAEISDKQLERVADEHLVPDHLLNSKGPDRLYARLVAPLARFYFATESILVAAARQDVIKEICQQVQKFPSNESLMALTDMPTEFSWRVVMQDIEINLLRFAAQAYVKAKKVDQAEELIVEDEEIMGGLPCFAGTRIPISVVLGTLDNGMSLEYVTKHYSFLTNAHVAAARIYAQVHQRRERSSRLHNMLGQL
jgi:uncharacterized protein (DUF433 family)